MAFEYRPVLFLLLGWLAAACGGAEQGRTDGGEDGADLGDGGLSGGAPVDLGAGVTNAWEMGGLPALDGQRVRPGVLLRSDHLGRLDADGCTKLTNLGVNTIVDLRGADEAQATPDATCALEGRTYVLLGLPKILPPGEDTYSQTLAGAEPKLAELFAALAADGALPALLHCVIGRDRAAITTGVVLTALGVPRSAVLWDFTEHQAYEVEAVWLAAVLDEIDAAGGIDVYLAACGVAAADLVRLRQAALE